jgi:hypothetical protein
VDKGGIQTWTSPTRPTKKLVVAATGNTRTGANLDAADEGLTGINTSTNSLERWDGTKWVNLLVGSAAGAGTRILTANFIYYVNNNGGNNANDGLTPETAWATPQYACDWISRNVVLNGFKLTIKLMDSTTPYTGFSFAGISGATSGLIEFLGNPTNPGACIIDTRDNYGVFRFGMYFGGTTPLSVRGFKFISSVTTMRAHALWCQSLFSIYMHMCDFASYPGVTSSHIIVSGQSNARFGAYTISGGTGTHIVVSNSQLIFGSNTAPTIDDTAIAGYTAGTAGNFNSSVVNFTAPASATNIVNNPTFSNEFISVSAWSAAFPNLASYSYTGACTGKKYTLTKWSNIANGVSFPGTIDGTIDATSLWG